LPSAAPRTTSTRDRILAVAAEVIDRYGYEKASLNMVADAVGITRPAIYYHFKSKEDLVWEFFLDGMSSLEVNVRQSLAASDDPHEQIRLILSAHAQRLVEFQSISAIVLGEGRNLTPKRRREVASRSSAYMEEVADVIRRGAAPGSSAADNASRLAYAVIGCLNGSLNWRTRSSKQRRDQSGDADMTFWVVEWALRAITQEQQD